MPKRQIQIGDFRIGEPEKKAINEVLDSGRISESVKVAEFERQFAKYIGTKYSVAVSSGTAALMAGITALKYDEGRLLNSAVNVITTPITYIATSNAVVTTGFNPIYVDIDKETFVIKSENIKKLLENADNPEQYSIILPVHLMGYPCNMDAINKIAQTYGLQVFEDSSQAHGTLFNGRRVGSLSDLACFSFYIAHNIQAGEMGAITTNDYRIVKLVKKIKANGRMCDCPICIRSENKCPKISLFKGEDDFDPRFLHEFVGYNFKTMEFQAALALTQLERADWIAKKRVENVKYLNEELDEFSDILQTPKFDRHISYMAYPIVIKKSHKISRKKIREELENLRIETRPLFGCIPTQQPAFKHLKEKYDSILPNANYIGKNAFYIGCHQYLSQDDLDYVVEAFKKILGGI
jgi:perosamine synthetase